ncbi:MAG: hypothetical protein A3A26_02920 [Candidatus Zambryskibacteria bacterium RIFCSPLOWO2_01_FULL_47_14]|uniref:D-alanine--D-alanine ligase n=1 Tax=Candidatus Zambryskibacteria bacterium RIFCSPLOWO2_01_FULL_47_14 TaxID=1802763 RepID=A0A1G2U8N8_9BACT|nr:MAG: hypothetical protein A3A26_02920 [Candidatus Zambryskibacteria bacterium RIFCSPLOWO2_01_FULL_47_14]
MTKKKLKVAVIYGGRSPEHEVSIESARKVIEALDRKKYSVASIKIPKSGKFNYDTLRKFDVVLPILHGLLGEDGTIQGLLKLINVPFGGAGVLGSAVGMDKDVAKRLLRDAEILVPKFLVYRQGEKILFNEVKGALGTPIFIKPANLGSSVGIHKVKNKREFERAVKDAFKYDSKIIIEETINGKEIECAVIGNEKPVASFPGEIIPKDEFYTYKAKYDNSGGTVYKIPARLSGKFTKKIQKLAIRTYKVLSCEGMGRVDMFLTKSGKIFVNEINTIPGPVMFRRMWEASGMPFSKVLDKLIRLAIERFNREKKLKTTFK